MLKKLLSLVLIFGLLSCKSDKESVKLADYFGQPYPDSIPIIFAPDIVSLMGRLEHGISFTPDTKELAFGILNKDDSSGEIIYSKKVNQNWTKPSAFEPLKGESAFLPYFSPDGRSMLFTKSKSTTNNYVTDIWILNKKNDIWKHPQKINSPISSLARESTACMTLNNTIYFSSNRDGNGLADLYVSSDDNGEYLNVERIDSMCTERDEESIFVSPDEGYMIFSRFVTDENPPDLFISYQDSNKNWTVPRALNETINTENWERRPFVTIDNKFLFFTKLTIDQSVLTESDIYWVHTQKVFKPYVFNPIPAKTIKIGKEIVLPLPLNYFKDIDNEKLEISLNHEKPEWVSFDKDEMTLTMNPNGVGEFNLVFKAVDKFSNETKDSVKIRVEK